MFPALLENPINVFFEGQDIGENIVVLVRAHPITNLRWLIPAVLIFLIPFFIEPFARFLGYNLFTQLPDIYLTAFIIINYLLVLVITFEGFLNWYFNVNIVTNEKIIDVDFSSILLKNIDYAPLEDVQEVTPSVGGVLGMIFNFGNIAVQTAGAQVDVDFKDIPNPDRVADIILDQKDKTEDR